MPVTCGTCGLNVLTAVDAGAHPCGDAGVRALAGVIVEEPAVMVPEVVRIFGTATSPGLTVHEADEEAEREPMSGTIVGGADETVPGA